MRRMLGAYVAGVLALAGVLVAAPASAEDEPPQVQIVDAPSQIPIDAKPRLIGAIVVPSPSEEQVVLYEWDVDGDGFDDGTNNAIIWNPAEHDIGTFTIKVRATVDGVPTDVATASIEVINQFEVSLGVPVTVTTGEKAFIGATVKNFPWDSIRSYAWDLDDDGQFDDVTGSTTEYVEPSWSTPGTYTIRVEVTHNQLAGLPATASTTVTVIPRVTLTNAGVTGTARAGYVLTSTGAAPTPSDAVRTWVWLREGVPITGATGPAYRLTTSDAGRRIAVRIGASRDGWGPALPKTSPTVAVRALNLTRPTVTGIARVGRKLTGARGTWAQLGHTFSYRWLRDGRAITGATRTTYTTTRADRGHLITFQVTAKRTGFPTVTAKSVARRIS